MVAWADPVDLFFFLLPSGEMVAWADPVDLFFSRKALHGKISAGNPPVSREELVVSEKTTEIKVEFARIQNRTIKVVDGPGIFETRKGKESAEKKLMSNFVNRLEKLVFHVVLIVLKNYNRFTEGLATISDLFGSNILQDICKLILTNGSLYRKRKTDTSKIIREDRIVKTRREEIREVDQTCQRHPRQIDTCYEYQCQEAERQEPISKAHREVTAEAVYHFPKAPLRSTPHGRERGREDRGNYEFKVVVDQRALSGDSGRVSYNHRGIIYIYGYNTDRLDTREGGNSPDFVECYREERNPNTDTCTFRNVVRGSSDRGMPSPHDAEPRNERKLPKIGLSALAFTVSHPHGAAQRVSFGGKAQYVSVGFNQTRKRREPVIGTTKDACCDETDHPYFLRDSRNLTKEHLSSFAKSFQIDNCLQEKRIFHPELCWNGLAATEKLENDHHTREMTVQGSEVTMKSDQQPTGTYDELQVKVRIPTQKNAVKLSTLNECLKKSASEYPLVEIKSKHGDRKNTTDNQQKDELDLRELLDTKYIKTKQHVVTVWYIEAPLQRVGKIDWRYLNEERWRLHTFVNYPSKAPKSAILLAADGFAYTGSGAPVDDEVICFFCIQSHKDWQEDDVIRNVHTRLSPNCPMVTGSECKNVPMPVLRNGEALFAKLDNEEVRGAAVLTDPTKGACGDADLEADSAPAISEVEGHEQTGRGLNQAQGHVQCSNDTSPASVPRPTQMTTRQPSQDQTAASGPNVAASQRTGAHIVTAHQATDISASSTMITSSVLVSDASIFNPSSQGGSTRSGSSDNNAGQNNLSVPVGQTAAAGSSTSPGSGQTASVITGSPAVAVGQPDPAQRETTAPAPQGRGQEGQQANANLPAEVNQRPNDSTTQNSAPARRQDPTYAELGIITERPKRLEFAVKASRLRSFDAWPRNHHLIKEDLADAGFYYAGYGDCARCFFCGGGLRNWEPTDNVWVEHARWFAKCAYLRQTKGQAFIDAVKRLSDMDRDIISYDDAMAEMRNAPGGLRQQTRSNPFEKDAAVLAMVEMGFQKTDALEVARLLKDDNSGISADKMFEKLVQLEKPWRPLEADSYHTVSINIAKDKETVKALQEQNSQLRAQTVCKICLDAEVQIVFLPCGHLVSCLECAAALGDCPVCRQGVRGMVRAYVN